MIRTDAEFFVDGIRCAGWFFRPNGEESFPAVVMAHGFCGTRADSLQKYAERFAGAGIAVLLFDYRHFGDSGGQPRGLVDVESQRADWQAALAHARSMPEVDAARVAIWGTSYSGGHVIDLAAEDQGVAAAVAQVPFTDGLAVARAMPPLAWLRLTLAALFDAIGSALGRAPHYVPVVARPGELGVMTSPDAYDGYLALLSPDRQFDNRVTARTVLKTVRWRPVKRAGRVSCPLLVVIADNDLVTPPKSATEVARLAPRGEAIHFGIGHFDVYHGEPWEQAIDEQVAFLRRQLQPAG